MADQLQPASVAGTVALGLNGISKRYGAVQALLDVTFECLAGEVHALVGANGSGKSTLLGIASGSREPDAGTVTIGGTELFEPSPARAHDHGLATVYQDNSLVLALTAAENLVLAVSKQDRPAFGQRNSWARIHLDKYGIGIRADVRVADLSPAQRQFLEIIKALIRRPRVLLLDEPTTALAPTEVQELQAIVRTAAEAGTAVVYVSHRLPEVLELADRITVLRDGEVRASVRNEGLVAADLVELMLGVPVEQEFPAKADEAPSAAALELRGLNGDGFGPVDLSLMRGEILGIAGAEGNGQRECVRAIAGLTVAEGAVRTPAGRRRLNSVRRALRGGTMLLSGDRHSEAIFPELAIRENMTIQVLDRFSHVGVVNTRAERGAAESLVRDLGISPPSTELPVEALSGGNQQKVVMSRSYLYPADVILADEPTQGVDAGARPDIYRLLRDRADEGTAVLVNSSDAAELAGLCDRVVVMSRGRVVTELTGSALTESAIVSSFLTTVDKSDGSTVAEERRGLRHRWKQLVGGELLPLLLVVVLTAALGIYTVRRNDAFFSELNLRFMLANLIPLGLVACAQLCVLLIGGFDVSVGGVMSISVVVSSVFMATDASAAQIFLGVLVVLLCGLAVGATNGVVILGFNIVPIIVTIGTLGITQGVALWIRPVLGKPIDAAWGRVLLTRVGIFPITLIVLAALAIAADYVLHRTALGLRVRATGLSDVAARRNGVPVSRIKFLAYLSTAVLAACAGIMVGSQIGNGDPNAGNSFILVSFSACVLGGASLWGGRGTFVGALLGGFLLIVIGKMPDFLELDSSMGRILTGVLTLVAILLYSGRDNWHRISRSYRSGRAWRASAKES